MKKLSIILLLGLMLLPTARSQHNPKEMGLNVITMEAIKGQLEFLASDWTEGRETGTKGIYLAGDYVASMLKYSGVAGAGDIARANFRRMRRGGPRPVPTKSYFQNFSLIETLPGEPSKFVIDKGGQKIFFQDNVDFSLRANSSSESSGQIVFVGYGIKSDKYGIDEIGTADLKGKIILRLSGYPGQNDAESKLGKIFAEDRMAGRNFSREKNNILEEKGALAVIDVSPGMDIGRTLGEFVDDMNMSPNESSRNSAFTRLSLYKEDTKQGLVSITVTQKVINAILDGSGINLEKYAKDATGSSKFKPVFIKNTSASIITDVKSRRVKVRNVVAMIEGEKTDEFIVVGAHMDHMGMSGGRIWNGADDNASGTVGVMTIARAFASTGVKPQRSVIFCAWTGEEKGLLGSTYWANNPSFGSIDQCKFYLNFDMISRDATNDTDKVNVGVTFNKNYPKLEEISKKNAEDYGLKMNFQYRGQDNPTGGSDYTAFTDNGVPIIAVMAAMHPEYHTPADQIELINWDKMLEIIKLGFLNMWDIANSDF
ncbi:MAG: M20/M25/M40 family metallo-hydrolase [Bacteroidales bacterium]|nr:M20/M25/M40 family metallo-hydrolase [Bacteroidales bacterium]